ncbi:hypothetical protein LCGC14_0485540 [marine sediment metagenome]|uniref:Type I restriction enzyme R protein N-terminal domain-containing protein n=1 Tax=marine sediment metagenome TaxID=412755 RepID=A0A0F9S818_9ZZZZ|nr:MAG: hypothetical protein Lokiarch_06460 [Candidatus Lokiarchaeum sp. GC14_75]
MWYSFDEIQEKIETVLNQFLTNENELLMIDSNELTISSKFSAYLALEFPEWDVDCEYIRDMTEVKRLKKDGTNVRIIPDIVIHHRLSNDNLMVIEVKKSPPYFLPDQEVKDDLVRLQKMTSDEKYNYHFGLFVLFYIKEKSGKSPILKFFQNSKVF